MSEIIWNKRIFYELVCDYSKNRRWLDLGCGRGPMSPELMRVRRRMGEKVYIGIDLDKKSLADCKEKNKVCANMGCLPFPDGSFDLVTSDMVFEHLDNPVSVLKEANRVMDRDGVLIIHTASSLHCILLAGRLLSRLLPRKTYVRLVSQYTERREEDIFPTLYKANTAPKFSSAAFQAGFLGGFVTYLETPLSFPIWIQSLEERVRPFLPGALKGTMLAIYFKRDWGPPPKSVQRETEDCCETRLLRQELLTK